MSHDIKPGALGHARFGQLRTERLSEVVEPTLLAKVLTLSRAIFSAVTGLDGSLSASRLLSGNTYQSGCTGQREQEWVDQSRMNSAKPRSGWLLLRTVRADSQHDSGRIGGGFGKVWLYPYRVINCKGTAWRNLPQPEFVWWQSLGLRKHAENCA